jgi:hypothetical protein
MKRNGKIAELPGAILAELNLRMENGEEGATLLAWLNGLPKVQASLKASFEGAPVSKQNLSEWRQGGFREWQVRQELIGQAWELADSASEMEEAVDTASLPNALAGMLAARYAALLNGWDGEPDPKFEEKLRLLRGLNRDIALLQKTMERASQREREIVQESEEQERREFAEQKKKILDILWSVPRSAALAGVLGGGEQGKKLAEMITAVENDLPISNAKEEGNRKKEEGGIGQAEAQPRVGASSKRVKDSQNQGLAGAPPSRKQRGQTESNPVKASQTSQVSQEPEQIESGPPCGLVAPDSQTESKPVKPEEEV